MAKLLKIEEGHILNLDQVVDVVLEPMSNGERLKIKLTSLTGDKLEGWEGAIVGVVATNESLTYFGEEARRIYNLIEKIANHPGY